MSLFNFNLIPRNAAVYSIATGPVIEIQSVRPPHRTPDSGYNWQRYTY